MRTFVEPYPVFFWGKKNLKRDSQDQTILKYFAFNFSDDANSYRDRLKVLRMKAGLDNSANTTEAKVCQLLPAYLINRS